MKSSQFIQRKLFLFVVFSFSLLVGCTQAPMPVPTLDQSIIVAAVVETINAQNTQDTLLKPTNTPMPTETQVPPTSSPLPATETPRETILPSETATQQPAYSASLEYVVTYPENKREYVGNERFGIALGFRNTGTVVWEPGTNVKLVSYTGEVTVQLEASINTSVLPGDKVEFDFWAFGSEWYGDHTFVFQLYNNQGLAIPGGYATFTYTSV
ncbi:MAG: hypothetical protein IH585_17430 [Anaerolineaceae bacterium]|nr:hypothetical protein [Anaerolineaceae bacterium]